MEIVHSFTPLPSALLLPDERSIPLYAQIEAAIRSYGFSIKQDYVGFYEVQEGDTLHKYPKAGTFDGIHIAISPELSNSERCFDALHLFGHSVTFASDSYQNVINRFTHTPEMDPSFFPTLLEYEFLAARFGLALLHQLAVNDIDRWYTDFVYTDHKMVETSYKNGGNVPSFADCVVTGMPLVEPMAIPSDVKPILLPNERIAY